MTLPRLSIVIASVNDMASLLRCLTALVPQANDEVEIIVAHCGPDVTTREVRTRFPHVRVLPFAERQSIPALRGAGFLAARGAILAMTEDHCVPAADWVASILRAHAAPHLAIGGAIENAATDRIIDWAVFFCEYGRHMPPIAAGRSPDLPGPNVAYKREAVEMFRDLLAPATWEPFWHWRLRERGVDLVADPRVVVHHLKHFTFAGFLKERYHYARSFAGRRVHHAPLLRRAAFALAAPLLPPLLLGRLARQILPKRRHLKELLLSSPYIIVFTLSWALGELVGYACGPGTSERQIA